MKNPPWRNPSRFSPLLMTRVESVIYLMQTFFSLRRRSKSRGNFGGRYDEVWWFGGNDPVTKVKVTEGKTQRVRLWSGWYLPSVHPLTKKVTRIQCGRIPENHSHLTPSDLLMNRHFLKILFLLILIQNSRINLWQWNFFHFVPTPVRGVKFQKTIVGLESREPHLSKIEQSAFNGGWWVNLGKKLMRSGWSFDSLSCRVGRRNPSFNDGSNGWTALCPWGIHVMRRNGFEGRAFNRFLLLWRRVIRGQPEEVTSCVLMFCSSGSVSLLDAFAACWQKI